MPAIDALSCRTWVQEQLSGQDFPTIIDAHIEDMDSRNFGLLRPGRPLEKSKTAFSSGAFRGAMAVAETYYLSPEMHEICLNASQSPDFPEDETILREDPPGEAGFLYFPQGFRVVELRGRTMVACAALWFNDRVWWLVDRRNTEDEMNIELRAKYGDKYFDALPRYDLMSTSAFVFGETMPKILTFDKGTFPPDARIDFKEVDGRFVMRTNASVTQEMVPTEQVSPDLRFLLTVWRMMQQTITSVVREEVVNKGVQRYAMRAGVKNYGVNVIQLRRHASMGEIGSGRSLSVRFPVRGHWRRIWCGPAENRYQRAIFIHPYLKGNPDHPLINRERINALIR